MIFSISPRVLPLRPVLHFSGISFSPGFDSHPDKTNITEKVVARKIPYFNGVREGPRAASAVFRVGICAYGVFKPSRPACRRQLTPCQE